MQLPQTPREIKDEHDAIVHRIKEIEADLTMEKAKLKVLQTICQHPSAQTWHSNPMGRWPTDHFQCDICGYYKET